jgi:hypothetical protein
MNISELESNYNEIQSMYESGELGPEEYINLLQGLEVEQAIAEGVDELYRKQQLNTYIVAGVSAATLLL